MLTHLYLAAALSLAALPAWAQQQPAQTEQAMKIDEANYLLDLRRAQLVAAQRQIIGAQEQGNALALQAIQEMLELGDYLRACGDRPGCTSPIEPPAR